MKHYRRIEQTRSPRERILILCEGKKTEPNYFKSIKAGKPKTSAVRIEVANTKKNTAKELVDEAIRLMNKAKSEDKNPYNEVWVVFDRDGYTKHPEAFNRANSKNIKIAFSSTCFEFWLLLHFEYTTYSFSNCDDAIRRLKAHIPDYEKGGEHFALLQPKINDAIKNGGKIIAHCNKTGNSQIWEYNPYTDVGLLVEKLLNM
jgi:hypothetical protein